ncbi:MAG: hypothetical protein J0H35_03425, partial [Rhodospirillales bacterium]|nr:hypothetical protein [Rhodospirillales bacterium]
MAQKSRFLILYTNLGRADWSLSVAAAARALPTAEPCAVAAELYRRHGDEFAGRLLGDFACLVLDNQRGALLGARDWIGARPLYWGRHGDTVAFAGE